ncbi:MAG: large subunit ribosomal protein L22 [Nitrospirae bacterium]|nr:MAG: large subunit ribosomal protein L22 [Nitrospirota bacterium]
MEAKAILRYARITPRKARRVVDLIRGKRAADAILSLRFMPYRGAKLIEKVLKSAMANAEQKNAHLDIDKLRVKIALVDQGPMMKRMEPRAMGRANMIKKKSSHITIVVAEE